MKSRSKEEKRRARAKKSDTEGLPEMVRYKHSNTERKRVNKTTKPTNIVGKGTFDGVPLLRGGESPIFLKMKMKNNFVFRYESENLFEFRGMEGKKKWCVLEEKCLTFEFTNV